MGWEEIYNLLKKKSPEIAGKVGKEKIKWEIIFFFSGNPFSVLTATRLAMVLNEEEEKVSRALDGLVEAGFLCERPQAEHLPQVYEFTPNYEEQDILKALFEVKKSFEHRR